MKRDDTKGQQHAKEALTILLICLVSFSAFALRTANFTGTWTLNPETSKNIGMMSQMKMTQTIEQSDSALDLTTHTLFQGNAQDTKMHYNLSGKPANNDFPMSGPSETISKSEGDKLVTTWTSQGAVAGSKVVRTETRSLSRDGKTMTVESVRGNNSPVVMVFDRR